MKKFDIFSSNLEVLKRAGQEDIDNEFIISGIIDKFFIQFELSWKVLKELLRYEGSREARIYDGEAAKRLVNIILQKYIPEFLRMQKGILERYGDILQQL